MDIITEDSVKSLAAALHEPNFEMDISWQRVKEGLHSSLPVVRSEYWLLKFLQKKIGIWDIKSLKVCSVLINEY